jgi:phosphoribosylaminoimidazolecarboxamide formyltransferase/IMP cyclohydrolase
MGAMPKIQRCLISVTDKTDLLDFARQLTEFGVEIISTGGTARLLREAGLSVRDVSEVTGFPEMLDGRVKTVHPRILGGILAMRDKADHRAALAEHDIAGIDLVVVNLYAFEKVAAREGASLAELIENIDIGGPTLIRAAAKNYQDVAVVVSPAYYPTLIEEMKQSGGELSLETRWRLAQNAFHLTAAYDRAISARLSRFELREGEVAEGAAPLPAMLDLRVEKAMSLRYGENPHQSAALYSDLEGGIAGAQQLHGKELSYNNLVDLDAAWQLVTEFDHPAAAIIKHTNPCGCAEQESLAEAYRKAFQCDPVSAYGGVLAFNRPLDEETAREIVRTFIEAIAAPDYSPEALTVLTAKRNLRLLKVTHPKPDDLLIKSISGGWLVQTPDLHRFDRKDALVESARMPTLEEWAALEFAWKVVKHVKSNAIVYAHLGQIAGVGAGQMSRVDAVKLGALKAVLPLQASVLASDGFFPFPDGVEEAASHGVTAIIQPGGSRRDDEVIAAADRFGLAMVFTGVRHFRH